MKSIIHTTKGWCYLCGRYGQTEEHHIFGGANRKVSEKYGVPKIPEIFSSSEPHLFSLSMFMVSLITY